MAATAPPVPPPAKKRGPLFYGLIGCGALLGIVLIVVVAGGMFVAHKAKQAGFDPELATRNPALAAAKMMVAVNPDVELVSSDDSRGTVTVREKKTGKTVTLNLDDIKRGRISFESDNGERVEFSGGEGSAKLPSWLPAYPGAKIEGGLSAGANGGGGGAAALQTRDSVQKVAAFYEQAFREAGLTIEKAGDGESAESVTLTGKDDRRNAGAIISSDGAHTSVALTYEEKN